MINNIFVELILQKFNVKKSVKSSHQLKDLGEQFSAWRDPMEDCSGGQRGSEHKDGPFHPAGNQGSVAVFQQGQSSCTKSSIPKEWAIQEEHRGIVQACVGGERVQESHNLAEAKTRIDVKAKTISVRT